MDKYKDNKEKIDRIINDIVKLDPELEKAKKDLYKFVEKFINNLPNPEMDDDFESKLKSVLINKINDMKKEKEKNVVVFERNVFFKKLAYSLGAILIAAVIIIPTAQHLKNSSVSGPEDSTLIITRLSDNAFGDNFYQESANEMSSPEDTRSDSVSLTIGSEASETYYVDGGAGAGLKPNDGAMILGMGSADSRNDITTSDVSIMPIFDYPSFEFVYVGDDLSSIIADTEKLDVYKRSQFNNNHASLLKSITSIGTDLMDLSKFNNSQTRVSNFSLNEERDFGYIVNYNSQNGNLSMYQNWQKWPQPFANCYDANCYGANELRYSDILSNEKSIEIAEKFMKDYNINRSIYGEAKIAYDFFTAYEESDDKSNIYIPEETTVIFPYIIDGNEVVDEGGSAYGLTISVSSRHSKVTSMHNLLPNNYQVSAYNIVRDANRIKEIAEQGGLNYYRDNNSEKVITVSLGTPTMVLSRHHIYDSRKGQGEEIYVPALSFPVIELSEPTNFYSRSNIVIPLISELIDNNQGYGKPEILPMPMIDMAR